MPSITSLLSQKDARQASALGGKILAYEMPDKPHKSTTRYWQRTLARYGKQIERCAVGMREPCPRRDKHRHELSASHTSHLRVKREIEPIPAQNKELSEGAGRGAVRAQLRQIDFK